MEVFNTALWAIRLMPDVVIEKRETLHKHGGKTVAIFSDSQAAIQRTAHLEQGPELQLAKPMNRRGRSLLAHGIATEIQWVPGHSSIPGIEAADHPLNLAQDARRSLVKVWPIHLGLE